MKAFGLSCLLLALITTACNEPNSQSKPAPSETPVESPTAATNPLQAQLEARKAKFEQTADTIKKRVYREGIEAVDNTGITSSALQVGDKAPDFSLTNAMGDTVTLSNELTKGPIILTWYRGGWCPYCNLTLHAMQDELPNFKAEGAQLMALSPELPDESISTAEKNELEFEVLSDVGNTVARTYGIVYQLTDAVAERYNQSFGLNTHNGDESNELPLAATYVITQDGEIVYAFLDADYRNRAEPAEITEFLKTMNK